MNNVHLAKLATVHKRALKLLNKVSSNSVYQPTYSKPLPLKKHLFYNKCVLMHKLIYSKCPTYLEKSFASTLNFNFDSRQMTLIIPRPRIDLFKASLRFSGTTAWNKLPKRLKEPCSMKTFKDKLLLYLHSLDPT